MPPVIAAESVVQGLAGRIVPAGVAGIEVGVLRPGNVDLGVVVVLDTVRVSGLAGLDLLGGEGVLDITPRKVVVA